MDGTLAVELERRAEEDPDFPIVTFENGPFPEEILTYSDLVLKGRSMAAWLWDHGIRKGDCFAVVMRNHPEFLYCLFAASQIGAVMVPIDPRSKGGKLLYQIRDSRSKGIVTTNEFLEEIKGILAQMDDLRVLGVSYKEGLGGKMDPSFPVLEEVLEGPDRAQRFDSNTDVNAPLQVMYTSGTTGDPKGVVIKGNRLTAYVLLASIAWKYTPEDRLYTGLSLTHGNAQAVTMAPSLFMKIPSVFSRRFTKSRIWDICRKYGCTTFSLLGGMMMGIYSEPPRPDDADNPVRVVLSAGTPRPIWEAFERRFDVKIHEWYGAVEGGFAHNPPGAGPVGSFGKPLEGIMEMKVVREDGSECEPHEIGELVSRVIGQETEVEYLGKKEASMAKTRGGWLWSGDMCHRDEQGWFYFDYRKGGGLRRAGDFIMPEFVEAVLAEHPSVNDVCVYGIPAASGAPGESDLVAAVVPMPGTRIDPVSIFETCVAKLENNAIPSYLQVVEEIPKSASEKNLDRILREEFHRDAPNVLCLEGLKP